MTKSYTVSVSFDVDGKWENFSEIPYSEFLKAMEDRLKELKREKYLDAFDIVDISSFGDEPLPDFESDDDEEETSEDQE